MKQKQLLLPLMAGAAFIAGCQTAPKDQEIKTVSTLKAQKPADVGFVSNLHVGQQTYSKQIPAKQNSTVLRSDEKAVSNAPLGTQWYNEKSRSVSENAIEQSNYMTNHRLGVAHARLQGLDGAGVAVAVVDTGIYDASRFNDSNIQIVHNGGETQSKHGDDVARLIADKQEGIAPNVELVDARHSRTSLTTQSAVIAAARTADIINHSGSYSQTNATHANAKQMSVYAENALKSAIQQYGALYVQSSGNEGLNGPNADVYAAIKNPELQKGYIVVTATNSAKDTNLASSKGETWANACGIAADFCMAAPGHYSEPEGKNKARIKGGTSYAAPRVAAAAALVKQKYPWASNDVLRTILLTTATDLGDRKKYGWGMLDIEKAINGPSQLAFGDLEANVYGVSEFSNNIKGTGGLIKTGSGALNLDGMTTYTGGTLVKNGTLNINNVHTGIITVNGGSLGGEGIVYTADVQRGTLDLSDGLDAYNLILGNQTVTKIQAEKTNKIYNDAVINGSLVVSSQPQSSLSKNQIDFTAMDFQNGYTGLFKQISTPLAYNAKINHKANSIEVNMTRKNPTQMSNAVNHSVDLADTLSQSARNADKLVSEHLNHIDGRLKDQLTNLYNTSDEIDFARNLYGLGTSVQANSLGYTTIDTMSLAHQATDNLLDRISNENFGKTDGLHGIATTSVTEREHNPDNLALGNHQNQISSLGASYHQGDFGVMLQAIYGKSNWDENYAGVKIGSITNKTKGLHLSAAKNLGDASVYTSLSGLKLAGEIDANHPVFAKDSKATVMSLGVGIQKPVGSNINVNLGGRIDYTKVDQLQTIDGKDYLDLTSNSKNNRTQVLSLGVGTHHTLPILNKTKVKADVNVEYDTVDRLNNLGAWQDSRVRSKVAIGAELNKAGKLQPAISLAYHNSKAENAVSGSVSLRF